MKHADLTDKIIACFFVVYNELGYGFLESVYLRAMVIELEKMGLRVQVEYPIRVYYAGQIVGEFFADLLVEGLVIVELKAVSTVSIQHHAQLLNYLNATRHEVGLLLNFGLKPEIKRKVFDNERKTYIAHG
ncbi:MAG TPA: GxxExxY protein [Anaerolineae bacterium]|nr:GxxExxY protein [Anaerolineae bacterium]